MSQKTLVSRVCNKKKCFHHPHDNFKLFGLNSNNSDLPQDTMSELLSIFWKNVPTSLSNHDSISAFQTDIASSVAQCLQDEATIDKLTEFNKLVKKT